ncbi:hypothetical protein [Terasakiella pusilla]|uniref:hypothetical protein n=1 Tax=Terasakiella pusilla TaxID=64973 RepID=UPI003AA9238E
MKVYSVFHLNLAFSSIEEEDRSIVIEKCYWPILRLIQSGYPLAIEMTGYTLETIQEIDPNWVDEFARLLKEEKTELVGSGYVQMIAPLAPPQVTEQNLEMGNRVYARLLGVVPRVALVNEQAYSPGLVPLYKKAGYSCLIMDWAEPSKDHPEWDPSWMRSVQKVAGEGEEIGLLWSDAITFQKFQRCAHGEIELEEYLDFLTLQLERGGSCLPLYTSDGEVFDYRPGRYAQEAMDRDLSEWEVVESLFAMVAGLDAVTFKLPSQIIAQTVFPETALRLESAQTPIPVKKQKKYNVLRWAVTGRDDLKLNTLCWRWYETLATQTQVSEAEWRRLLLVWSSDLRTHITQKRWDKLGRMLPAVKQLELPNKKAVQSDALFPEDVVVTRRGPVIDIDTPAGYMRLNANRGLAIRAFGRKIEGQRETSLLGTIAHGFYEDISFGADFYSGHFVAEPASSAKLTDLVKVEPEILWDEASRSVIVCAEMYISFMGKIRKEVCFQVEDLCVDVRYDGDGLVRYQDGVLRFATLTLNPTAFDPNSLYYACHNGGRDLQYHSLSHPLQTVRIVNHGAAVSRLVTASTGLGMTQGFLLLGDQDKAIKLTVERAHVAGVGQIHCEPVRESYFCRATVSLREWDETSRNEPDTVIGEYQDVMLSYKFNLL